MALASELFKFVFDGLPVRGALVRLDDAWQEILARRAGSDTGAEPSPVRELLGEMVAAGVLMQSNIKFNGTLLLQIFGDGPLKLAVAEVQSDLRLRATAKCMGDVSAISDLPSLVDVNGRGRCAITLDPQDRVPGQQPYQGVVGLRGQDGESLPRLSDVLEQYMLQSEQLDTRLILAANDERAAGLLIQRLPTEGGSNLGGKALRDDVIGLNEDFHRIAHLASTLTQAELLTLDAETLLRRLFWQEPVLRFEPARPRFACTCSRDKVASMLRSLGPVEVNDVLEEQGQAEVHCDFCGQAYRFDAVDVGELFTPERDQPPTSTSLQ